MTLAMAIAGCSSSSSTTPDAATLRPGVEDSSQVYKGTPNADESQFWTTVRGGDDNARGAAVAQLLTDIQQDPSNGYSEFLIGASYYMPPTANLNALANGTAPPQQPGPATVAMPVLKQSLMNLTDPFYLGFAGGLLSAVEFATGDPGDAVPTQATAYQNNPAASRFISVLGDLSQQDRATALTDMSKLFEFCNGAPLAADGSDAASYVAKMNSGTLVHRECYSGFFAPHGSSGELFVMADLQALNGNTAAASAYYSALRNASDYSTWPLKPLAERRIAGTQPADIPTTLLAASTCATCHTSALP